MKPKKQVETYSGKMLQPSDCEAMPINTEDFASVLFEFDNGARGSFSVSQVFAGRKTGCSLNALARRVPSSGIRNALTKCGSAIVSVRMDC
jgi:hypothetical protein